MTAMRDLTADIDQISEIVAFPTVIAEIQAEILKDNVASARIAQLVKLDATLTAQVLRAVNSPYYGLRWQVVAVTQAIALLGVEEVGRLVLLFHMRQQMFKLDNHQAHFLDNLWKHSLSTGLIAQTLAAKYQLVLAGKAFTAGLMHDIGKIVLAQYYPIHLEEILQMTHDLEMKDVDSELQLVGITHAEIGAKLCTNWQIPPELIDLIRNHHEPIPTGPTAILHAVVRFADLLCETWQRGIGEQPLNFSLENDPNWLFLREREKKLQEEDFKNMLMLLAQELERRMDLFHLSVAK
jgi:putative nucleotidyltransferase with HDIG domain